MFFVLFFFPSEDEANKRNCRITFVTVYALLEENKKKVLGVKIWI